MPRFGLGSRPKDPLPSVELWTLKGGASALGNGSRKCVMEKSIRASEYDVNIAERFKAAIFQIFQSVLWLFESISVPHNVSF